MGVSKDNSNPQIIHFNRVIGVFIIFTIHFGVFSNYFWVDTQMMLSTKKRPTAA